MEKETNLKICRFQVIEQLPAGTLVEVVAGLRLDDNFSVYDHAEPLARNLLALVHDGNGNFTCHTMTSRAELALQSDFVNVLEESKPKCVVNLKKPTDDGSREGFFNQLDSHRHTMRSSVVTQRIKSSDHQSSHPTRI